MSRDQELSNDEDRFQGSVPGVNPETSPGEMDKEGASPDNDVIELVDVVSEGGSFPDDGPDDLSLLLDEEENPEKWEDFLDKEDEDLKEFSLPLDESAEGGLELAPDERDDVAHDSLSSPDFDFETPEESAEPAIDGLPEMLAEEDLADIPGDDLEEMSEEDLAEMSEEDLDEVEGETSELEMKAEEPHLVSQERLESIITETVTEVVERVVRETVAEVSERVIKEAIESLRQSLETTPE